MSKNTLIPLDIREVKIEVADTSYITLSQEAYYELMEYVNHCSGEVSGCGLVEQLIHEVEVGEGLTKKIVREVEYQILEVFLPSQQTNTCATTDIGADAVASLMYELIAQGKDTGKLKMHWHSHVNMGVFHSGTDNDNYKDLLHGDFLVSLVLNKKREILGRVDVKTPFTINMIGVPVFVYSQVPEDVENKIKVNIQKLDEYTEKTRYSWKDKRWTDEDWNGYDGYTGFDTEKFNKKIAQAKKNVADSNAIVPVPTHIGKLKHQLRSKLGITKLLAQKFEDCADANCGNCAYTQKCTEYMYGLSCVSVGGKHE